MTRDLVRQGHVTLKVTLSISACIYATAMIFFFDTFSLQESQWNISECRGLDGWPCTSRSRDLESDTFYLSLYTRYSIDFPEVKNYRNKKILNDLACTQAEIESVTFMVTWPWRTRSPVKVTTLAYIPLTFLSLKNLETKKNIAVACIQAEIESVTFKVTWPWRTRSTVKATTFAYMLLTFLSWKTLETKKIIAVACKQAEIESVTFKVTWPWYTRSTVKATAFVYIPLTFLKWKSIETKKPLL